MPPSGPAGNLCAGRRLPARFPEVSYVKVNVRSILLWLTIAFVVISIWNSPSTTGNSVGNFLGAFGNWAADVVDKGASFLKGLKS